MVKKARTPLEKIQEGKGREIAQVFFLYHFPSSLVTKLIYPKAYKMRKEKNKEGFTMPIIQNYLSEWKEEGFIDAMNIKIPIEKKNNHYTIEGLGYRMNLNPLYLYCKEKKNIEFTEEEKGFVDYLFLNRNIRYLALKENPDDDVIKAIAKYYFKHYIYIYSARYKLEEAFPKENICSNLIEIDKIAEKLNKKIKQNKKANFFNKIVYPEIKKSEEKTEDKKLSYIMKLKQKPKFIIELDLKFLKLLGVL